MKEQLTAAFQQVPEGYIGFVEELPGANTLGARLMKPGPIFKKLSRWCWNQIARWQKNLFGTRP
jgi:hypothetical protein